MSANTPTANSSYDSSIANEIDSLIDTVASALDSVGADQQIIEEIEQQGEQTAAAADKEIEQLKENADQQQQEIEQERERRSAEIEGCHNRISNVEQQIDDETPTVNDDETTIQPDDLTPIEQLAQSDEIDEVTDSQSVRRAVSLFENLPDWGSRTPKGVVLKPADNPLKLLEADRDESLCWKQYYRAAKTLEQLSKGSVTFVDSDRHGKMIVLHEQSEAYSRIASGQLSSSSVEETA